MCRTILSNTGTDVNGNLTSIIYPGGKTVTYGYDKANRLTTVTDWAYRETGYEYDANGRLIKTTCPDGSIMTIGYDAAGQILWQNDIDSAGSGISRYEFTYDVMGNITVEESVYGDQFTLNNNYDAVYQILGQEKLDGTGSTFSQYSFGYDPGGNITVAEEVYGPSEDVMTYTYDNRLATFNSQNVTYDADGNMTYGPLSGAMVTFNHDARNRLTGVGDFSYIYDALNNRISVTETVYGAAYSTNYVINPNAALSQTLIKTDPDGTKTYYIYGLGLIGEETDGVYRSYHYDFRGSTVALTDSSGDVTERYSYGPYGELLSNTGSSQTPFLYNGRDGVITDDNGLYYMRARYCSPEIKRFISEDSFGGKYDNILNINLYTYTRNNPILRVDPSGYKDYIYTSQTEYYTRNDWGKWEFLHEDRYFAEIGDKLYRANSLETVTLYDWDSFDEKFLNETLDKLVDKANEKATNLNRILDESVRGELNFKLQLNKNQLYLNNGIFYNRNEAGNFVWSYFLESHGFGRDLQGMLAQGGSLLPPIANMKGTPRLDEPWDVRARHSGSYYYYARQGKGWLYNLVYGKGEEWRNK